MEEIKESSRTLAQIQQEYYQVCGQAGEIACMIKKQQVELARLYTRFDEIKTEHAKIEVAEHKAKLEEAKKKDASSSEITADTILASSVAEVVDQNFVGHNV